MSLRTNYKNDVYDGKRKYLLTVNDDGTYTIDDVTTYLQDGDTFEADDINDTNKAVNQNATDITTLTKKLASEISSVRTDMNTNITSVKTVRYATFSASKWSSSVPYSQTVSVSGLEASDTPVVSLYLPSSVSASDAKAKSKAYGYVDRGVTASGSITLYCYNSKPTTDFQIAIKGE